VASRKPTLSTVNTPVASRKPTPSTVNTPVASRKPTPAIVDTPTPASRNATTLDESMAVDVPLDLQGASRTIGGVLRGRALGNFLNHADKETNVDESGMSLLQGKVLFYTDRREGAKPSMSLKHEVTPKLSMVLTKLARSFSPIRSKSSNIYI
jgi:hypothetical protein